MGGAHHKPLRLKGYPPMVKVETQIVDFSTPVELLDEKAVSRITGRSPEWLRAARAGRGSIPGPRFIRLGRAVRYTRADVEAWVEAHDALVADQLRGAR